ncbi:hypothetical protein OOZ19_23880 [Saccharopolyspora sp. NFXS83]|uniref:hypothetical protein n=1 Tax=Saccharopolyspora sp. NFXS83 TaxID=2993560 RepID=UPI00224B6CBA|nr:hypothetical protein [Saccharopolyspora sp. NFXS83]MCX2733294.1 hypothetical protein [Saccharopolyspora sp. NFXS83]
MTGFRIDPEALEGAIRQLEDARDIAEQTSFDAAGVKPGELTAKDSVTSEARQKFADMANGNADSLRGAALAVRDKLNEKIQSYRDTLDEYRRAEDNATVDADRINRRA